MNRNENVVPKIPTTPAKSNYSVQYNRKPHGLDSLNKPIQDEKSIRMESMKTLEKQYIKKEEKIMKRQWRHLQEQMKKMNAELLRKQALLNEMNKIS